MDQADLDAAAALARSTIGVPDDVDALSRPVRRLDRDTSYVLVQLGRAGEPGWVAAVDPRTADVMAWAANATGASTAPEGHGYDGAAKANWYGDHAPRAGRRCTRCSGSSPRPANCSSTWPAARPPTCRTVAADRGPLVGNRRDQTCDLQELRVAPLLRSRSAAGPLS